MTLNSLVGNELRADIMRAMGHLVSTTIVEVWRFLSTILLMKKKFLS